LLIGGGIALVALLLLLSLIFIVKKGNKNNKQNRDINERYLPEEDIHIVTLNSKPSSPVNSPKLNNVQENNSESVNPPQSQNNIITKENYSNNNKSPLNKYYSPHLNSPNPSSPKMRNIVPPNNDITAQPIYNNISGNQLSFNNILPSQNNVKMNNVNTSPILYNNVPGNRISLQNQNNVLTNDNMNVNVVNNNQDYIAPPPIEYQNDVDPTVNNNNNSGKGTLPAYIGKGTLPTYIDSVAQKAKPNERVFAAQYYYNATFNDEIHISPGDLISFGQCTYDDGWAHGRNLTKETTGVFPLGVLIKIVDSQGKNRDTYQVSEKYKSKPRTTSHTVKYQASTSESDPKCKL